jgi:hypothetical protein
LSLLFSPLIVGFPLLLSSSFSPAGAWVSPLCLFAILRVSISCRITSLLRPSAEEDFGAKTAAAVVKSAAAFGALVEPTLA